jgi:hypothetical protein
MTIMLNVAVNLVAPMVSGGLAGTLEWPALGAVLVWLLILCVLGVSVGVLREYKRLPSVHLDNDARKTAEIRLHLLHKHLNAA